MELSGARFIVTGGGSGLGAATVRRLHARGARVLVCNRDSATGERLAGELGAGARFVRTDVTNELEAARAVDMACAELGGVDGLVNCAGIGIAERVLSDKGPHSLETFLRLLYVNAGGTFNMIRLAAAAMSRNAPNGGGERGVIVNTASIAAYDGQSGQAAYAAANAAVIGMTLPIARELATLGIRVVTIAPGPFLTPRLESLPSATLDMLAQSIPFPNRLGRADEYAALAQHIVENEMLNGETIRLDGALRLPMSWKAYR